MLVCAAILFSTQLISGQQESPELIAEFQVGGGSGQSLALNGAGTLLASTGNEGDLILYDLANDQILWTRQVDNYWLGGTRFSPDGTQVVTIGENLVIYDLQGNLVFSTPASFRSCAAWNNAGTLFAYQYANKVMRVVETQSWTEVQTFPPVPYPAKSVYFSTDGKKLIVGDNASGVSQFSLDTGELDLQYKHPNILPGVKSVYRVGEVNGNIFSIQGTGLVQVGEKSFPTHKSVYACELMPDGTGFAISGGFHEVYFYNFEGTLLQTLNTGSSAPSISFATDTDLLAVGASSGHIQLWKGDKKIRELSLHPSEPKHLAFSADGNSLLASGKDSLFFDLNTLKGTTLQGFRSCTSGAKGREIVCLEKGAIVFRDGVSGEALRTIPFKMDDISSNPEISLSPNQQYLAIGGDDWSQGLSLVNLSDGSSHQIPLLGRAMDFAWTADSQSLAMASIFGQHGGSGALNMFSPNGDSSVRSFVPKLRDPIRTLSINPSGSRLVYCQTSGSYFDEEPASIHAVDLSSGKEVCRWEGDYSFIRHLDESTLLAHSWDRQSFQFLDAATLEPIGAPLGLPNSTATALSPDGKRLALTDGSWVRVYQLPSKTQSR